jgi:hypothetical protein
MEAIFHRMQERINRSEAARDRVRWHAAQGGRSMALHRFNDATRPHDLAPPVRRAQGGDTGQMHERLREYEAASPGYRGAMVEGHANGDDDYYPRSPFVSGTTDTVAAAQSRDGALSGIARDSPNLATSIVPRDQVVTPHSRLSNEEGERLAVGTALEDNTVENARNPYEGGLIRLSRFTPNLVGHMSQDLDGPEGDQHEHTDPLAPPEPRRDSNGPQ